MVKKSSYLFGPVFSRRLGRSLGVDLLEGQCTQACPYCEVRVRRVEHLRRFPFRDARALYARYREFCKTHSRGSIDVVTFTGTGEPTLVSNLGDIIRKFRRIGTYPVAVLTNGTLLWMPSVRRALRMAQCVVPSLDAATEPVWRKVNRPHPSLSFEKYLDGMRRFCAEHPGAVWMEVLLVRGMNDSVRHLNALGTILRGMRVDRVQVGTVDRPPVSSRARPVSASCLTRAARIIRERSGHRVDVASRQLPSRAGVDTDMSSDILRRRILASVRMRPQTESEIARVLGVPPGVACRCIRGLKAAGLIRRQIFGRRIFLRGE